MGPGTYYLVARHRSSGHTFEGPLLKGDLVGYCPHNPLILRSGTGLEVDVSMAEVNRPRGSGSLSTVKPIVVSGLIRTEAGYPASGVRVVLYGSADMLGRPLFISSESDAEGRYILEVSTEGVYFAAARSAIGKPPERGELIGFHAGSADRSLDLRNGKRFDDVDFTVKERW
jgi:hypothetical protein